MSRSYREPTVARLIRNNNKSCVFFRIALREVDDGNRDCIKNVYIFISLSIERNLSTPRSAFGLIRSTKGLYIYDFKIGNPYVSQIRGKELSFEGRTVKINYFDVVLFNANRKGVIFRFASFVSNTMLTRSFYKSASCWDLLITSVRKVRCVTYQLFRKGVVLSSFQAETPQLVRALLNAIACVRCSMGPLEKGICGKLA